MSPPSRRWEARRYRAEFLALATGVRARTVDLTCKAELAADRLAVEKGIVVDAMAGTSLPNVFAAGRFAQVGDAP